MYFSLIAAQDASRGIGKNNTLPWRLPPDLAYFQEMTIGKKHNAVIMGRSTWDSLPEAHRPLSDRYNIVLTRQKDYPLPEGVDSAESFEEALKKAAGRHPEAIFVIGGQKVFAEAINDSRCEYLYITQLDQTFECDSFFPEINPEEFEEVFASKPREYKEITFQFLKYRRKRP
ncbi:hypothetical protein CO046_02035 [Candidatus Peregrinibacteria bacterium CG_4_9_14_0_2_um_filter_53_11]|nr:MAG: hypothetical protein CO046_02035 [Candidatus Peregrinibacteria bacterium CG_4_9_14_0_2_um_filter_53_11]